MMRTLDGTYENFTPFQARKWPILLPKVLSFSDSAFEFPSVESDLVVSLLRTGLDVNTFVVTTDMYKRYCEICEGFAPRMPLGRWSGDIWEAGGKDLLASRSPSPQAGLAP